MKLTTLNFLIKDTQVLLAMKKRSFGEGKWNGVGGKVEEGETLKDAVIRETKEETTVSCVPSATEEVAVLTFFYTDKPEWNQECHIFVTKVWEGEPKETEDMRPQWFSFDALPFESMWVDDPLWLPLVLHGTHLRAEFYFSEKGARLEKHIIEKVEKI
jgi:ADP-ribose pyrophosphatase YjhB (NUDIX family)